MRFVLSLFAVLIFGTVTSVTVMADDTGSADVANTSGVPSAPQISFSQQVNIVVTVKRDPRVFEMKINQDNAAITLDLIVDQKQDRAAAQEIAHHAMMVAKSYSLDDKPENDKEPGAGLYDYKLRISRPDGVVLITAEKLKEEKTIRFENPVPVLHPLTRAGVNGR